MFDFEIEFNKKIGCIVYIITHLLVSTIACGNKNNISINRASFPASFDFGIGSSAYQYEGATTKDGRGPCIWDTFIKKSSGSVADHSNASITTDQYHRYKEDVRILKDIGFDIYRFSISWSRVLPKGGRRGGVNKKGINHYNKLINHLLSKGIKPIVTLFHWDLPQVIEDQYQGFLNPKIIDDFRDYAELCFNTFGDRVKLWVTINEPMMYAQQGYASATFAPGRCSNRSRCSAGDSSVEPYIVAHHLLLAHAAAVKLYKEKYQISQKGQIGISLNTNWMVPYSNSQKDQLATDRGFAFTYGWFMEPLYSGSYPLEMIVNVGKRLSNFTKEETNTIKGSYDFIGINYYTARYIADTPCRTQNLNYITDSCIDIKSERNGIPIGPHIEGTWMYIYPEGLQYYLLYIRNKYNDPVIYITENGVAEHKDNTSSILEDDKVRIEYFHSHLSRTLEAIRLGVNVKGYIAWSFLDNFEWTAGYTAKSGIVNVDFKNGFKRYPKQSSFWFKKFLTVTSIE
ncbi:beta-glucosidase 12-like [Euphorbia lathyris]|uniref:beta-glucosidase 12-like n=1 Tax=Euphorbia lathyris TaxID=212925 RepID=UPI0033141CB1